MKTNLSFRNGEFGQKCVGQSALFRLVGIRKSMDRSWLQRFVRLSMIVSKFLHNHFLAHPVSQLKKMTQVLC